jgi:hypothetical protein
MIIELAKVRTAKVREEKLAKLHRILDEKRRMVDGFREMLASLPEDEFWEMCWETRLKVQREAEKLERRIALVTR